MFPAAHSEHELTAEEIARLVAPAFADAPVETAEVIPGGRNANVRVTLAGRALPYLLRIHARGREVAQAAWDVTRLVYRRAPVPEIVWAAESGGPQGQPCSIQRWVEGVPLSEVLATESAADIAQAARAVGEVLAHIGGVTFREPGFLGPGPAVVEPTGRLSGAVRSAIEYSLFRAGVAELLGEQDASRVWTFAMRCAHRLDRLKDTACLVHGGFHPDHILMRRKAGAWTVAAVVGWEDAFAGSPLWDVGALLRHTDPVAPVFADPFLAAFERCGGELPPEGRALARLCDLVPLMQRLTGRVPDTQALRAVRSIADRLVSGE